MENRILPSDSKAPLKAIVFGAGMVGEKMFEEFRSRGADVRWSKEKIHTEADLAREIESFSPHSIVNAIGKTGKPNVDWCEDHKEETYFSNVDIPRMMSAQADRRGICLVHISSGCIYSGSNGDAGFDEADRPNFDGSFYSFTKYVAERLVSHKPNVLTARLRIPLLPPENERGIIAKLMKYETIIDTPNSISYIPDFINAIYLLCMNGKTGIWNITNPEPITHRRILEIYDDVHKTHISATKKFISPDELVTKAPRSNCILSSEKIQKFLKSVGSEMRHTEDAVRLATRSAT